MDTRDRLAHYPFVIVRIACRVCSRRGSYRLARLAAKYGPEITLRDLTDRFSYDCLWRAEARSKKGKSGCGVYLPDLEQPRPPDAPPWDGEAASRQEGMNYLTCAPTAEYAVSNAVWGLEAEHPLTPTIPSTAKKRQSLRDPTHIRNP